jgi:hypothetical protein
LLPCTFAPCASLRQAVSEAPALGPDDPQLQQWLSFKQQYHEALQEIGLAAPEQQQQQEQQPEGAEEAAARARVLSRLRGEVASLAQERREELAAVFEQLGLPPPDLSLDEGGGSSGSKQKQLTGS